MDDLEAVRLRLGLDRLVQSASPDVPAPLAFEIASLAARLRRTHLLLLGYTLSTWTLRVVLDRFWGSEPLPYRSWSVHPGPQPLEREFWRRRDVEVVDMAPAAYVAELERVLEKAAAE